MINRNFKRFSELTIVAVDTGRCGIKERREATTAIEVRAGGGETDLIAEAVAGSDRCGEAERARFVCESVLRLVDLRENRRWVSQICRTRSVS